MLASEIFASVRTDDVRCASPPTVVQAGPPRPCACEIMTAAATATAVKPSRICRIFILIILGVSYQLPVTSCQFPVRSSPGSQLETGNWKLTASPPFQLPFPQAAP